MATQTQWDAAGSALAGLWDLCANCQPGSTGKKLYRQMTFNLAILGVTTPPIPPIPAQVPVLSTISAQVTLSHSAPMVELVLTWTPTNATCVILANGGNAMANPFIFISPGQNGAVQINTAAVNFANGIKASKPSVKVCIFTPAGCPGKSLTMAISVTGP